MLFLRTQRLSNILKCTGESPHPVPGLDFDTALMDFPAIPVASVCPVTVFVALNCPGRMGEVYKPYRC
jgi:hypothetical protein